MKAVRQKIKLQQLLNHYSLERLSRYSNCPQVLANELRDLKTLIQFSESDFAQRATDLRKKSLEYDKTFRFCDRYSKDILPQLQKRRSQSNHHFAYSIHCLNPQSIVPQFPQRRLLTELKLKFLESEDVDEFDWQKWYCPQENILLLKAQGHQFQLKLGISLVDAKSAFFWQIFDVTCNQRHHQQLFYFLLQYIAWFRNTYQDCQNRLIRRLELLLNNLSTVLLFLTMREEVANKGGEIQKQTLKINLNRNSAIKFVWKFQLFDNLSKPKITFLINDQQCCKLLFHKGLYLGEIYMKSQSSNSKFKIHKPIQLCDKYFLYSFSLKIYNSILLIQKFQSQYQMLNSSILLLLKINGQIWKSQRMALKEEQLSKIESDGVWGQISEQTAVFFKIEQDMSLSYPQFQKGFFGYLLAKMSLADLIDHISLRHQLNKTNKEYQFKIFRVKFFEAEKQIGYQFRSYRYNEVHPKTAKKQDKDKKNEKNQKIEKNEKNEDNEDNKNEKNEQDPKSPSANHINTPDSNDNFIILAKIAFDFSRVSFLAFKVAQGQNQKKEITDNYFPKKWKQYRDRRHHDRFEWKRIFECISYLCKCYLVERSYHRRMTEDQRKMTVFSFK